MPKFQKHRWMLLAAWQLLYVFAFAQDTSTNKKLLLPVPQLEQFTGKSFNLGQGWVIKSEGIDKNIPALRSLREEFRNRFKLELNPGTGKQDNSITLVMRANAVQVGDAVDTDRNALSIQAYQIELNSKNIVILANAPQGLFYGVQTLLQIIEWKDKQLSYPEGRLTDWPDMNLRIIYWDDAHHLEKFDVLKNEIKQAKKNAP